jgi:hypothetical protein
MQVQYDRHDTGGHVIGALPPASDGGDSIKPAEHDIAPA